MNTGSVSDRWSGPPAVSRNGVKSLAVHREISSVFVSTCPLMCGNTTSRTVCQPPAPMVFAVSSWDGGTAASAELYSIIENAVPRQVLNTISDAIGYSTSQAVDPLPSNVFSVPPSRSSTAVDRKSVVQGKSVDLGGRRIIKKKRE